MAPAKTVTVEACVKHTYHGKSYDCGDTYECNEADVESLEVQGKATPVAKGAAKRAPRGEYKTTAVAATRTTDLKPTPKAKALAKAKAKSKK